MAYLNETKLIGNLGRDPEIRYMTNGDAVANFSIATTKKWKDKISGEKKERTEWHNLVAYKGLAKIVGEYLNKGDEIFISGEGVTRKWQDKEGVDRYTHEIIIDNLQMFGGRGKGQSAQADEGDNEEFAGTSAPIPSAPAKSANAAKAGKDKAK